MIILHNKHHGTELRLTNNEWVEMWCGYPHWPFRSYCVSVLDTWLSDGLMGRVKLALCGDVGCGCTPSPHGITSCEGLPGA